jgi:hypothetical protein
MKPRTTARLRIVSLAIAFQPCAACTTIASVDLLPEELGSGGANGGTAQGGSATGGTRTVGGFANGGALATGGSRTTSTLVTDLPPELIHLYDFEGTGSEVVDRTGGQSGVVLNGAQLNGLGQLPLNDGLSYVRLPSWLIKNAKSSSVTIATWITWHGGSSWQRVFDFGATNEGTDQPGTALAQFYFTPKFEPFLFYSTLLDGDANTGGQADVPGTEVFPTDKLTLVVVVVEGNETLGTSTLHLYLDGVEVGTPSTVNQRMTEFTDQNCWLGQSQWVQENNALQHFHGIYEEFRIYSRALSATEVARLSLTDPTVL